MLAVLIGVEEGFQAGLRGSQVILMTLMIYSGLHFQKASID
jgi:hypothetical protein